MEDLKTNRWKELKADIGFRLKSPLKNPEFILYFFSVVVITGLMGFFLTFYVENKMTKEICCHNFSHIHVALSIASYFIALLTASSVDLILSLKSDDENSNNPFIMIGISALILGLCFIGGVILTEDFPLVEYFFAISGLLIAWFIWWISNAKNPNLNLNPRNATPQPKILEGNESKYNL